MSNRPDPPRTSIAVVFQQRLSLVGDTLYNGHGRLCDLAERVPFRLVQHRLCNVQVVALPSRES